MAEHLLIVEDEPAMLKGLLDLLQLKGYQVTAASTGTEGLSLACGGYYDLILLDVMLPDLNGFDLLQELRRAGKQTPVIMLTAKNTEMDKVLGFELGIDDYVTKPFSLLELLGRITAVLRRTSQSGARSPLEIVHFGSVAIDLKRYQLTGTNEEMELPTKAYDLLRVLINQEGQVVSRDALIDAVWGASEFINHRTVNNLIVKLRQAIEPNVDAPRYLKTVHGIGYRLDREK